MEYKSPSDHLFPQDPHIGRVSLTVYELMFFAYPLQFRNEYGRWMVQAFRDRCLHTYRLSGLVGIVVIWISTLFDWLKTSFEQHTMKGMALTRALFTRICGWSLLFGVAAILLGELSTMLYSGTTDPHNSLYRSYDPLLRAGKSVLMPTWVLLTAVGIAGLYARFGVVSGWMGRGALASGVLGEIASFGLLAILGLAGENVPPMVWEMAMTGLLFMFGGLFVFGLSSLHRGELTERSCLSLFTGGLFLLMITLSIILASEMPIILPIPFLGLIACGLFLLGRLLLRPNPQLTT
jgi:hypothetical protein